MQILENVRQCSTHILNCIFRSRIRILLILTLIFSSILFLTRSDDSCLRALPTDFNSLESAVRQPRLVSQLRPKPFRYYYGSRDLDIDGRYIFQKELGHGQEGSARLYRDTKRGQQVVIKRYHSTNFRDLMPRPFYDLFFHHTLSWPTEVPASLLISSALRDDSANETSDSSPLSRFVVMQDYFLAARLWKFSRFRWHFVTPFLREGSLQQLSSDMWENPNMTPSFLDEELRPSLNQLLLALEALHQLGYCHDDITMGNVFVKNRTDWMLGDLGNMREINHPFHFSRKWRRKNQWSDCRLNDVRRMLKTYMGVVRAVSERALFDQEFFEEAQPWSSFYWSYIRNPVSAYELVERETHNHTLQHPQNLMESKENDAGESFTYARDTAITRELKCTTIKTSPIDWWYLGGLWPTYQPERNEK